MLESSGAGAGATDDGSPSEMTTGAAGADMAATEAVAQRAPFSDLKNQN